jgi:3',5'-cyclic AMP phosphodiesterase CpdA
MYEDGELVYTNIFNVETNYDSYGNKIWQLVMTLCQWQVVMTKSRGGIQVNINYQLNKCNTFTM